MDFNVKGMSTLAQIGKILILVGILLSGISALESLFGFSVYGGMMMGGYGFARWGLFSSILPIAGVILGILAWNAIDTKKDFKNAGILGIIGGVLSFDIVLLAGGVLCLISDEGKKGK